MPNAKDECTIFITHFPRSMRRELKIIAAKEQRPYTAILIEAADDWLKRWRMEHGEGER